MSKPTICFVNIVQVGVEKAILAFTAFLQTPVHELIPAICEFCTSGEQVVSISS